MNEPMPLKDVVRAFLGSLLDTNSPAEIRAAFKECGFVTDPDQGWRTSADGLTRTKIAPDAAAPTVPSQSVKLRI